MFLTLFILGVIAGGTAQVTSGGQSLAPGIELRWVVARQPSSVGDSRIAIVRIDPTLWELVIGGPSPAGEALNDAGRPRQRTAREWAKTDGFAVVINAGMFGSDYETHVGYMEFRGLVNSSAVNVYQSVAAFDPRDPKKSPPFRILDLDAPGVTVQSIRRDYGSLVQNLRLIQRPGRNRWGQQDKKWSEAALGEDGDGRILFIFSRSPFSMHDLNKELLSAGIGLVAAQHLEGGPEAQLYVNLGDEELEMIGSYETSFREDDGNATAWPIPNVLGVRRRTGGEQSAISDEPRHELCLTIQEDDASVTMLAKSDGFTKAVGPWSRKWCEERFRRLHEILEPGAGAGEELRREKELRVIVGELSDTLLVPIESAIDSCSEVVFLLPHDLLEAPIDLLQHKGAPLFLQKPVYFRVGKSSIPAVESMERWTAFVVSDSTSDPERACRSVAEMLTSATYLDAGGLTGDVLRRQPRTDVVVLSLHGVVGSSDTDHMCLGDGIVLPSDFLSMRPKFVYFDSCRLGVSWQFLEAFREMGTQYYLGPILSNEAGDSSTRTMTLFFRHLVAGQTPEAALFLTRRELYESYGRHGLVTRLWKAYPFRLYRLN